MKRLNLQFLSVFLFLSPVAMAQNTMMSEDEALKNFKEAAKLYRQGEIITEEPLIENAVQKHQNAQKEAVVKNKVAPTIDQAKIDAYEYVLDDQYAPIEDIVVAVDLENKTLEQVVSHILKEAEGQAGKWAVKWRVSPENNYILSERVNLIAETNLSEFMSYLVDRVNNMTGIQLFVTVFDQSRIIVISDTYY